MKHSIIILICAAIFTLNANAQLKVIQNGKVLICGERTADDPYNEVSEIVYGKYGNYLTNGRLAIGDYGSMAYQGGNVFIGEYGTEIDSDILQLHGKLGIYLTRSTGDIVAYYKYSEGNKFNFNCDVYANGLQLTSDARLKNNINKLNKTLPLLQKLDGVSYNLTPAITNEALPENDGHVPTEKEQKAMSAYEKAKAKELAYQASKKRLGFIAQDVQKIFPELVEQDSAGYLSIDYIGLIPVMVEAIKEQQQIIEDLQNRITIIETDCCNKEDNLKSGTNNSTTELSVKNASAKLYQNNPNPFSVQTTIRFEIPETVQSAQLHICNMTGTLLKTITISQRSVDNLKINANEFVAGMYLYSLVCDGKIVDTKQMLLTE
jgi:hypothetical protein